MRARNTLTLLVAALAIGAYIYYFERKAPTTDEARKLQENLLRVEGDDVEKLRLARGGASIICQKKVDGEWEMTHPLTTKADSSQVRGIVSRAASLRKERELDLNSANIKEYGLDEPRAELRLWHGDTVSDIKVGAEAPLGNNVYVSVGDEPKAYAVTKGFFAALDKSVEDLRDKTIMDVAAPNVSRIKALLDGKEAEAVREGEHWKLVNPVEERADDDKANGILNKLKGLRAEKFVSDEPGGLEAYGLSQPPLEVALFTGEEMAAKRVSFGKTVEGDGEKVYAKREGLDTVYAVRKGAVDDLREDIEKLRSEKLFRAKKGDVQAVTISRKGDLLEMRREGSDWKIVKPVEADAETSRVDKLIRDLTGAKVKEFAGSGEADEKKHGLKEPEATVALKLGEGESEGLSLGKSGKNLCYVRREGEKTVLGADRELEKAFEADFLPYVKKDVLSFDKEKVERLTLKRSDGEFSCEKGEAGEWSFSVPGGGEPDGKKLDSVLVRLSRLRAKDFVAKAEGKLKQHGLEKPSIEAVVELKDGAKHALLVGKECDEGYYAMLRDGRLVFTVPSSLVDSLKAGVVSKEEAGEEEESE